MTMYYFATHEEIVNSAATLNPAAVPSPSSLKGDTIANAARRVVTVFRPLLPALMTLSSLQLLPAVLRAGLTILIQALDALAVVVSLTPASPVTPVTESLASDGTTTTDPTSTDPSFKAGKDL
jgi:hypothetical protein